MAISGKRFCPKCDSEEVQPFIGGITGTWMCKECGYVGVFPERALAVVESRDIVLEDLMKDKKEINKKARKKR